MQEKRSIWQGILLVLAGLAILSVIGIVPARFAHASTRAQGGNLLQNGGFEGDYASVDGDSTRRVAPGWKPWNVAHKASEPGFVNLAPEYRPAANQNRIRGGSNAQEYFQIFSTYTGGVFQQVSVTAGSRLHFSAFINIFSTSLDDENVSEQPSPIRIRVGIDPFGGTDGTSPNIVWAEGPQVYDQYQEVVVEADAANSTVTVFVETAPKEPVRTTRTYVDDASLTVVGQAPAETTAAPATTAAPGETTAPTLVPPTREGTIVPGPTTAPTNTPLPVATTAPTQSTSGGNGTQTTYKVQPNDTLVSIAQRFGSTVDLIIRANGLNSAGLIFVGQQLVIPAAPPTAVPTAIPSTATAAAVKTVVAPVDTADLTGPTNNGIGTYIVQPGDTIERIAAHYEMTVEALMRMNGILNKNQIVIGTVLVVPGPGNNYPGGTAAPTVIPTAAAGQSGGTHTVQPGENLFRISLKYNVSLDALMRANNITNPNLVFVGQVLRIP